MWMFVDVLIVDQSGEGMLEMQQSLLAAELSELCCLEEMKLFIRYFYPEARGLSLILRAQGHKFAEQRAWYVLISCEAHMVEFRC